MALGYAKPTDAVRKHCRGVSKMEIPSVSGNQEMSCIPESDVYRLIMRGHKARRNRRVTLIQAHNIGT